jgi:porphobilinogen synthase
MNVILPNRPRRLRQAPWVRALVREHTLTPADLIWPLIVHDHPHDEAVAAMPGVSRLSIVSCVAAAREARDLGIPLIAIFPHIDPSLKNEDGSEGLNSHGLIPRAVAAIKDAVPEVGVMCDVALDPYTTHGHDGVLVDGAVHNDRTVERLMQQALMQAKAGADVVAPSDMMDGRVGAIRHILEQDGHSNTLIMAYAAKYASGFYGPYREAVGSASVLQGDKKTYQMDPANGREATREINLDVSEGADMILIKPGMPYLDIVAQAAHLTPLPVFAYQVSGEYSMMMASAERGWCDRDTVMLESLMAFKRAGARGVITYFARDAARLLSV